MSKILLPGDRWTSQPQYPARVDKSGTLFDASRLSAVIAPGSGTYLIDALRGTQYTVTSNPAKKPSPNGIGVQWVAGTDDYIEIAGDADDVLDTSSCSMLIVTVRTGTSTSALSSYGYVTSASDRVQMHLPFTDSNIYWDFGNSTAGSGRLSVSMSAYMAAGTVNIWGFSAGSRGREIWRNGVLLASNTGATATRGVTSRSFRVGAASTIPGSCGAPAHNEALFVLSKEQWSRLAFRELTLNPWRVFAPQQRSIWVDVSGGPNVSVNVTGLTGTSALGTVSVTAIQNASTSVTGLTGTSALGTVTVTTGGAVSVNVTGLLGTSALGTVSVTAVRNVSTSVTGLLGTSALGSVTVDVGGSTSANVTGLLGTSSLGTVSITAIQNVSTSVTGLLGTSALGSVTVTTGSGADVSVNVTGLSGTASLGTVLVWGLVDTAQTPNWLAISTTQTPNWIRIAT